MRQRAEIVERSFAHNLERGGMRRIWLRGRENVHKLYLVIRPTLFFLIDQSVDAKRLI